MAQPEATAGDRADRDPSRPCRRPHIEERQAGEHLILYDPVGGRLHDLNATAAAVWRMCDGSVPATVIASRLGEEFDVGHDHNPQEDVRALLREFLQAGLIEDGAGHLSRAGGGAEWTERTEVESR